MPDPRGSRWGRGHRPRGVSSRCVTACSYCAAVRTMCTCSTHDAHVAVRPVRTLRGAPKSRRGLAKVAIRAEAASALESALHATTVSCSVSCALAARWVSLPPAPPEGRQRGGRASKGVPARCAKRFVAALAGVPASASLPDARRSLARTVRMWRTARPRCHLIIGWSLVRVQAGPLHKGWPCESRFGPPARR